MTTTALKRSPIALSMEVSPQKPQDIDVLRIEVAQKAATLLGYTLLKTHLAQLQANITAKAEQQTLPLAQTLLKLGIQPLASESVATYQYQQQTFMNQTRFLRRHPAIAVLLLITSVMGVVGLFVTMGIIVWAHGNPIIALAAVLCGLCLVFVATSIFLSAFARIKQYRWHRAELRNYSQPVPEFVLELALTVKEQAPGVVFWIEYLANREQVLDPFLIVISESGAECYYIEVWAESKFETNLIS